MATRCFQQRPGWVSQVFASSPVWTSQTISPHRRKLAAYPEGLVAAHAACHPARRSRPSRGANGQPRGQLGRCCDCPGATPRRHGRLSSAAATNSVGSMPSCRVVTGSAGRKCRSRRSWAPPVSVRPHWRCSASATLEGRYADRSPSRTRRARLCDRQAGKRQYLAPPRTGRAGDGPHQVVANTAHRLPAAAQDLPDVVPSDDRLFFFRASFEF
jgi:hypothetical protein